MILNYEWPEWLRRSVGKLVTGRGRELNRQNAHCTTTYRLLQPEGLCPAEVVTRGNKVGPARVAGCERERGEKAHHLRSVPAWGTAEKAST